MIYTQTSLVKQTLAKSKLFKGSIYTILFCLVGGLIFTLVGVSSQCVAYTNYNCSDYFDYYPHPCRERDIEYCCGDNTYERGPSCGGYTSCFLKPFYYNVCEGELITGWTLFFIAFISTIVAIFKFCSVKRTIDRQSQPPFYQNMIYPVANNQVPVGNWGINGSSWQGESIHQGYQPAFIQNAPVARPALKEPLVEEQKEERKK